MREHDFLKRLQDDSAEPSPVFKKHLAKKVRHVAIGGLFASLIVILHQLKISAKAFVFSLTASTSLLVAATITVALLPQHQQAPPVSTPIIQQDTNPQEPEKLTTVVAGVAEEPVAEPYVAPVFKPAPAPVITESVPEPTIAEVNSRTFRVELWSVGPPDMEIPSREPDYDGTVEAKSIKYSTAEDTFPGDVNYGRVIGRATTTTKGLEAGQELYVSSDDALQVTVAGTVVVDLSDTSTFQEASYIFTAADVASQGDVVVTFTQHGPALELEIKIL